MKSFFYAFRGIFNTIKTERNMRIHFVVAFYVIVAGIITKLTKTEWVAVILCIGSVIGLECINTAIEKLCDTVYPEKSMGIRLAKDAGAGGVLVTALASAVVGGMIFFNTEKINLALDFYKTNTLVAVTLTVLLIPFVLFIVKNN